MQNKFFLVYSTILEDKRDSIILLWKDGEMIWVGLFLNYFVLLFCEISNCNIFILFSGTHKKETHTDGVNDVDEDVAVQITIFFCIFYCAIYYNYLLFSWVIIIYFLYFTFWNESSLYQQHQCCDWIKRI